MTPCHIPVVLGVLAVSPLSEVLTLFYLNNCLRPKMIIYLFQKQQRLWKSPKYMYQTFFFLLSSLTYHLRTPKINLDTLWMSLTPKSGITGLNSITVYKEV